MKTNRTPKPKRTTLTGADHHLFMLLSVIDDCDDYHASHMVRYRDLARVILAQSNAFTGGVHAIDVTDCVLKSDAIRHHGEDGKSFNRSLDAIIEGHEDDTCPATNGEIKNMFFGIISESTLIGAALMFELLKGGAR